MHRHLRRDRANGMLGGVAAGISRTYGIDVTLVRVVWVVAAVLWIGVPAYIVAWIAIAPGDATPTAVSRRRDPKMILGLALVALGAIIAGNRIVPHGLRFGHIGAPLVLIGGGLAILLLRRRDDDRGDGPPDRSGSVSSSIDARLTTDATPPTGATVRGAPDESPDVPPRDSPSVSITEPTFPHAAVPPSAWTQTAPWPTPSARAQRRSGRLERRAARPRAFLTPLTLSVLLIGAGIASLLEATGALDVNLTIVLAIGTAIVGVALVVAAFFGRAHSLILVGVLLLAATGAANTVDVPLRGGIGNRTYTPLRVTDLPPRYELGIGELQVDLRQLPLTGRTTVVHAQTGIGALWVYVPSSVRVEVHAHTGAGSVMLFGPTTGGWPENVDRAVDGSGAGVLQLDLRVGAGAIRVRRFEPGGIETIVGDNGTSGPAPTRPSLPTVAPLPTTPPIPTPAIGNG